MFLVLPARRELLLGLLGADVIGFHTRRYRGHFTAAVRRLLQLEMDADQHLRHDDRAIRLGIYPVGTDALDLSARAYSREVAVRVLSLRAQHQRLLLGVDRLDYTKGLPRKMAAFEQLLELYPQYRGHVRLVQIAVPSREGVEEYQRFRRDVERYVSRINGRFGTPDWTPIQYIHRSIEQDELLALYRAADVMLVTPLRDGMNLVAKEFVASRSDEEGVLLLSEFAGAADELRDALLVNPYDVDGTAQAMHRALSLDGMERRRRMRAMRSQVLAQDVRTWAASFLHDLDNAGQASAAGAALDG
jgi:trehalose 6-phosphate synthase/phosphatase